MVVEEPVLSVVEGGHGVHLSEVGSTVQQPGGKPGQGQVVIMEPALPIHDQATRFAGKRGDKQDGKGNGLGIGSETDPMFTLTGGDRHAAFVPEAEPFTQNQREEVRLLGDIAMSLQAEPGSHQQTYLAEPSVRRLTPVECERLQGFPDNWTDGQADSHRYKQMGNAVAVPCVEWIIAGINNLEEN